MSITFINKNSGESKEIVVNSEFLNTAVLKKMASIQLSCHGLDIRLFHYGTNKQYCQNEIIKQGQQIEFIITSKTQTQMQEQPRKKNIVYPMQLQKMIQNSKIIVIKSANEQNIQRSKQHSLWATTHSNQERLRYFYNNYPNVLLLFATNRSFEIKGLAKMDSEPDKVTDKTVWVGVSNIRLGGNFRIKWLRKKPLSLSSVEKNIGNNFKEMIVKSSDGQELDPQLCKKIAFLFETPSQPYYPQQQKAPSSDNQKNTPKEDNFYHKKFPPVDSNPVRPKNIDSSDPYFSPKPSNYMEKQLAIKHNNQQEEKSDDSSLSSVNQRKKNKKIKKQKRKKNKRSRKQKKSRRRSSSSQSSSSSSSDSNSSSSSSSESRHEKRRKKGKKSKKQKK